MDDTSSSRTRNAGRKFRSRRPDIFDVGGKHCNITPSRGNPAGGYDYATKDGEVVAGGLERPSGGGVSTASTPWHWVVSANSVEEFWGLARELDPNVVITNFANLQRYAAAEYVHDDEYVHPSGFEFELGMVPELAEWREQYLEHDGGGKQPPPSLARFALGGNPRGRKGILIFGYLYWWVKWSVWMGSVLRGSLKARALRHYR
uniref:Replication-associated protein n=1 Tax=Carpodacus sibiricus Genomoviridae sp. TaxID=2814940 RepID=A0A8A4XAU4_9VIRU|nr:MAG: replication-associated protein [Carpodacus sibiricus Genomoviridae sp.]